MTYAKTAWVTATLKRQLEENAPLDCLPLWIRSTSHLSLHYRTCASTSKPANKQQKCRQKSKLNSVFAFLLPNIRKWIFKLLRNCGCCQTHLHNNTANPLNSKSNICKLAPAVWVWLVVTLRQIKRRRDFRSDRTQCIVTSASEFTKSLVHPPRLFKLLLAVWNIYMTNTYKNDICDVLRYAAVLTCCSFVLPVVCYHCTCTKLVVLPW